MVLEIVGARGGVLGVRKLPLGSGGLHFLCFILGAPNFLGPPKPETFLSPISVNTGLCIVVYILFTCQLFLKLPTSPHRMVVFPCAGNNISGIPGSGRADS